MRCSDKNLFYAKILKKKLVHAPVSLARAISRKLLKKEKKHSMCKSLSIYFHSIHAK